MRGGTGAVAIQRDKGPGDEIRERNPPTEDGKPLALQKRVG